MEISQIKNLRNKGDYDAALAECFILLKQDKDNIDVLRLRASIHTLKKSYEEALQDYRILTDSGLARIGDFYLASDVALLLEEYEQACVWLHRVIKIGLDIEDDAFSSAAHFLLAYGQMQIGEYEQALKSLEIAEIKDVNISLPLPGESGVSTALHMRNEINRRKARPKRRL